MCVCCVYTGPHVAVPDAAGESCLDCGYSVTLTDQGWLHTRELQEMAAG